MEKVYRIPDTRALGKAPRARTILSHIDNIIGAKARLFRGALHSRYTS